VRTFLAGQGLKRFVGIIAVLVLLGSMVPAAIAVAQDDGEEPSCPDGLVYDAEEDICLLPEDVPSEGDLADEADDSAEDGASDEDQADDSTDGDASEGDESEGDASENDAVPTAVTNVVLHAYSCPDGWDIDTEGLDASYEPCSTQADSGGAIQLTGPEGVTFDLSAVGDLDAASTGTTLPAGTWTVTQTSGGPAWANCLVFDHDGNQIDQVTGPVEGSSISFDLTGGDWLECEWFVNGAAGSGSVSTGEPAGEFTFTAGRCPYGYEFTPDRQLLMSDCTLKGGGGNITASVDGVQVAQGEIRADDPVITLIPVIDGPYPSGEWTVNLYRSDDTSSGIVYCDVTHADGSPGSTFNSVNADMLTFTVAPGDGIACVAYVIENFARAGSARGLTIDGHLCPEGTLRAAATLETCNLLFDGGNAYIEFDLYAPDDSLVAQSGLAPDTRQWTFAEVDRAGTWRLVFRPLIIDTPPVVTCTGETIDGQTQPLSMTTPTDDQPGIEVTVGVDHKVTCDLLLFTEVPADADTAGDPAGDTDGQTPIDTSNLQGVVGNPPAATGTRVNFSVRNCEAGTVLTDDFTARCTAPAVGVTFTVSSETTALTTGSTNSDGAVEFMNVPDGEWAFIETLPAGFGAPVVVCMGTNVPENFMDVLFGNQIRVSLTIFSGQEEPYLDCSWFNIPAMGADNGPQIFVQARRCQLDVDLPGTATLAEAEQQCPAVFAGKTFTVGSNSQDIESNTSGSNGQVFFTKLPTNGGSSQFTLLPTFEARESNNAIFCDKGPADGPFTVISPTHLSSGGIQVFLTDGETMRCSWFITALPAINPHATIVPGAQDNYFEMYVRVCPPSVTLEAADPYTCVQDMTGIDFDVTWNGSEAASQGNSATNGIFSYDAYLGPGTYVFSPRPVDGFGDPRYTCEFAGGPNDGQSTTGTVTSGTGIPVDLGNGIGTFCMLYYQAGGPAQQGAADTAGEEAPADDAAVDEALVADENEEPAADGNTLTIQFWTCPEGVDPADAQANLLLSCTVDQAPRAVTVTTDGGAQDASVTGSAEWPFTGSQVSVTQPDGAAASSAWCSSSWIDNGEDEAEFPDAVSLDGGVLTLTVSHAATTVYCDWFLFGAAANGAPSQVPVLASIADHTAHYRRWSG
jgi:hypothetical protein